MLHNFSPTAFFDNMHGIKFYADFIVLKVISYRKQWSLLSQTDSTEIKLAKFNESSSQLLSNHVYNLYIGIRTENAMATIK